MASFAYMAVDAQGRKVQGTLDAEARPAAARLLRQRGLTPVSLAAAESVRPAAVQGARGLSRRAAEDFCRELANLLAAGIAMSRALAILVRQARPAHVATLQAIHDEVAGGESLATALRHAGGSFSAVQTAMVQAGETGGFLDVVLAQIAEFQSRERDLRGRIRSALAYPAVLATVAAGVLVFLLTYFIPKFSTMFAELGGQLPALTQAVVAVSQMVIRHGPVLAVLAVAGAMVFRHQMRRPAMRGRAQQALLACPGVGTVAARLALVRFTRMLGTLLGAGVGLVASLRVAREALGNPVLADAVGRGIDDVVGGRSLSGSLQACPQLFPPSVIATLAVAEEAGRLDQELLRLADVYDKELDRQLRLLVSLAEPLLLFLMAGLVGTVVIGMLLPIFSLQDLIR